MRTFGKIQRFLLLLYAVKDLAENLEIKNRNEVCLFWKGKKVEYIFRHAVILLRPDQRQKGEHHARSESYRYSGLMPEQSEKYFPKDAKRKTHCIHRGFRLREIQHRV